MNSDPYRPPGEDAQDNRSGDLLSWLRQIFVLASMIAGAFTAHRSWQLPKYRKIIEQLDPGGSGGLPAYTLWCSENRASIIAAGLLITAAGILFVLRSSSIKPLITAGLLTIFFNLALSATLLSLIEYHGLWNWLPMCCD